MVNRGHDGTTMLRIPNKSRFSRVAKRATPTQGHGMEESGSTAQLVDRGRMGERGAFSDDALISWTLPSRYYTDASIHTRELTRIFRRSWCYVGHETDIGAAEELFYR